MGNVGDIERITQKRVVKLFKEKLGYTYLGNWENRPNNSNIEEALLTSYLSKKAVAETIENNVRQKIIKEHLIDPAFFEVMSVLLNEIIKERKVNAISYEEYLKKIADLAKKERMTAPPTH